MYLKIGNLIINTAHLVTARVSEDEGARRVELTMSFGRELVLQGEEAARFLEALPVYEPVRDK